MSRLQLNNNGAHLSIYTVRNYHLSKKPHRLADLNLSVYLVASFEMTNSDAAKDLKPVSDQLQRLN